MKKLGHGLRDEIAGRVYSTEWQFNAGWYSSDRATYGSFYALLPGGDPDIDVHNTVVELRLDGQYDIKDPTDLVIHGQASPGTETVPWDATTTAATPCSR